MCFGPRLLLLLPLRLLQQETPRLLLEDAQGHVTEVEAKGLSLTDPRERGGWLIRPEGFPAASVREGDGTIATLTLAGGDELHGHVRGGAGERLALELTAGVALSIDVAEIQSLTFSDLAGLAPAAEGDRLYRRTGDALDPIDGTVEGFTDEGVRFDSLIGMRTFPWSEVAALFIEELEPGRSQRSAQRVPVIVDLADGSRVRGELVALEEDRCRLALHGVPEISLPLSAVFEITVDDGRVVYLSDLDPTSETGRGTPFGDELGMTWPHRMDRNVLGGELSSGGAVFRHGIGMHAPSRLAFQLEGGFRSLRGAIGIDDSALSNGPSARGAAIFRLLLDGKKAWESPLVRGEDGRLSLPVIDLAGARELVLEVDPAGDFAGDRADWLRVILVR